MLTVTRNLKRSELLFILKLADRLTIEEAVVLLGNIDRYSLDDKPLFLDVGNGYVSFKTLVTGWDRNMYVKYLPRFHFVAGPLTKRILTEGRGNQYLADCICSAIENGKKDAVFDVVLAIDAQKHRGVHNDAIVY